MSRDEEDTGADDAPLWTGSARSLLSRHGLRARRSLGQNFLGDPALCGKIADLASVEADQTSVLEIGAGTGALTSQLLERARRVVAVETDRDLCALLRGRFESELASGKLRLIEADVRELDLGAQLASLPAPRTLSGNLPYHLSGLLLRRAIDLSQLVERSVFLLQLEVVERLCARPGSPGYGALSVFTQAVYRPERAFLVKRGAFYPQPGVDSATVVLSPLCPPAAVLDADLSSLIRAAFEKRRKTLRNAWRGVCQSTPERLEQAARASGVDLGARGETLAIGDFERMARALRAPGSRPGEE